jgi:ATP-dependent helicase/DNAse subunit B
MDNVEGQERLPHHRFLRFLEKDYNVKKAKWKTKMAKRLVKADFTAIVETWDKYTIDSTKVDLSPLKVYATEWNRKFTKSPLSKSNKKKHSLEDILRLKREYILSTWRDREKEKRVRAARKALKGKEVEREVTTAGSPSHGDAAVERGDESSPSLHMERDRMSDDSSVTLQDDLVEAPEEPNDS